PVLCNDNISVVPKPVDELIKTPPAMVKGGQHTPTSKMEEATFPYTLADGVTLEENTNVVLTSLTSMIYGNSPIINVDVTNAGFINLGSTQARSDNSGKEADMSFRPQIASACTNGSDGR
ncbi:3468_t:CDS:2, partial [Ambispora gerdemannii]